MGTVGNGKKYLVQVGEVDRNLVYALIDLLSARLHQMLARFVSNGFVNVQKPMYEGEILVGCFVSSLKKFQNECIILQHINLYAYYT